jgi:flagellar hook assembly protein FlgD
LRKTIEVFDLLGKKVNTLMDEDVQGKQRLVWDGTDASGVRLRSGVYFIRLNSNGSNRISKVILE